MRIESNGMSRCGQEVAMKTECSACARAPLSYTRGMGAVQSLYLVALALCVFSTGIAHGKLRRQGASPSYLTIYLFLEALCFLFELLVGHPRSPLKALWMSLLMATSLLIAPALWLAIKESIVLERRSTWSILAGWERALIVVGFLLTLPLLETTHLGTTFDNPTRAAPPLLEPLIHETMLACIALFALQVPLYVWRCRKALLDAARADSSQTYSWLQVPLVIVCTAWLLGMVRTLTAALSEGGALFHASVALIDVAVTIGCVYVIVNRIAARSEQASHTAPRSSASQRKYARSQLDDAVRARVLRKLDTALGCEAMYRDSALNLKALSAHVRESEHYVSQVISQDLGTNFYDLVNVRRIAEAQQLLLEVPQRTVIEIALEVGFNSKSTFNTAFKRLTGTTPTEFRAARHSQAPMMSARIPSEPFGPTGSDDSRA